MRHIWLKFRMTLVILLFLSVYIIGIWAVVPPEYPELLVVGYVLLAFFLVSQYMLGKRAALNSVDAHDWDDPLAKEITESLAESMNVPAPKIQIGHFSGPNAFAVGRKGNGVVVLDATLVEILHPAEIEAVIAHEISHLRSRDTTVMLLGQSLDILIYRVMARAAMNAEGLIGTVLAGIVITICIILRGIVLIPLRLISRKREYIADEDAVKHSRNPQALASALRRIGEYNVNNCDGSPAEEVNALSIWSSDRSVTEIVLGTHPPTKKRVERIESLAD